MFHETCKLKYIHVPVLKVLSSIQSLRALLTCVSPNSAPSLPSSLSFILTFCPISGMEVKPSNSSRDKPVIYMLRKWNVRPQRRPRLPQSIQVQNSGKHFCRPFGLKTASLQTFSSTVSPLCHIQPREQGCHQNWSKQGLFLSHPVCPEALPRLDVHQHNQTIYQMVR